MTPEDHKTIEVDHKQADKNTFFARISFLVLGVAIGFLALLGYWAFQSDTIFEARGDHVLIMDKEALAGGTVTVQLDYCKVIDKPVQFTRSFVNQSTVISNPTLTDTTGKGCFNKRIVEVPVPAQAASGEYRVRYTVEAEINPIKVAHQEFYSRNSVKVIGLVDQKLEQ